MCWPISEVESVESSKKRGGSGYIMPDADALPPLFFELSTADQKVTRQVSGQNPVRIRSPVATGSIQVPRHHLIECCSLSQNDKVLHLKLPTKYTRRVPKLHTGKEHSLIQVASWTICGF